MANGFVRQRELTEVMSDHLWFDFNLVEGFTVVNTDDASDHVGKDDHVSEMGFHNGRFLVGESFFLGLAEFLHQSHWLHFQTTSESTSGKYG